MKTKHLDLITRVAALSAYLQTEQAVEKSHTLAAKLKGEELRRHLLMNTDSIRQNLRKQYKNAKIKKDRRALLDKWKKFYEDHKDRWPEQLDLIQARAKENAS